MQYVGIIISAMFILFLPGFFISFIFFKWKTIDHIERIALSIALSLAVVPLIVFYCNLVGIKITPMTVILEVAGIMGVTAAVLAIQHMREGK